MEQNFKLVAQNLSARLMQLDQWTNINSNLDAVPAGLLN